MHWITRNIDWYSAFSINLGLFFPYFYLQLFSIDQGISSGLAFYSITLLNAGSVLGRIFPNFFADRCGTYNILLPCLFISSALAFSMFAITNFTGMAVFGVLYGFWSGSYVSLIPSLLAQLSLHAGEHGTRMGIAFSIVGISLLVGTPLEGGLLRGESGTNYTCFKAFIHSTKSRTPRPPSARLIFPLQRPNNESAVQPIRVSVSCPKSERPTRDRKSVV